MLVEGAAHASLAFDDGVGGVSGTWIIGRPPSAAPGVFIYIMVASVAADHPEITARFRDPAGNVFGLYQQPAG